MKNINIFKGLILLVGLLLLNSCSEETYPETRLFRPVLNSGELKSIDNTIIVDMGKLKSAVSYKIEVSRDTFKTIIRTIDTPQNKVIVGDLLWKTLYQVRATAIAANPEFNSKPSDFGGITTDKFPTIMQSQTSADVTDISVKIRWSVVAGDKEVTSIKVFAGSDEELKTPLASYDTTSAEILAGVKNITGLTPGTKYQIAIYSGTTIRGWDLYTTKPAIPTTGDVIDLRGQTDPNLLMTTLKDPATKSGTTIILDGDMTYNCTGYSFDKSITIKSGYSTTSNGAVINVTSNFNLAAGSVISSIVFDGITFTGTTTTYIFNINTGATVEDVKFDNCRISTFRGLIRIQGSGTGYLNNIVFNNSIVTDIRDYGVINVGVKTWKFNNIAMTNSTFYKCQKFIVSVSTTAGKSILISDCTLNEETALAQKIFQFPNDGAASSNVTDGVTITNTIIGRGWDMAGTAATYGIDPVDGLTATNFFINNSFATADYTVVGNAIPGFPNATYPNKMTDLWVNPATGDFNFQNSSGFAGTKTSGDPRWRK